MRYLKRFESAKENLVFWFSDLINLTENSLVYLLDDGFELEYEDQKSRMDKNFDNLTEHIWVDLYGPVEGEDQFNRTYTWSEVKDYYIPFTQLLKNRYELGKIVEIQIRTGYDIEDSFSSCSLTEIINDELSDDKSIIKISIKVMDKI